MGVIKTAGEIVREVMSENSDICTEKFIESVCPIYGSTEKGTPEHIGSSILIKVRNKKILLTAAHIIDWNQYTTIYIGTGRKNELVVIQGDSLITEKTDDERKNDHYDFAWLILNSKLESQLSNAKFLEINERKCSTGKTIGKLYLALGFPNSKNKKILANTKSLKSKYVKYSSTVKPDDSFCKELGISGDDHLFLNFDSKYSKDQNGNKTNSIEPKGMSGGALIDVGNLGNPESYRIDNKCVCRIVGLLIENHKRHKAILVVKLNVIIKQIIEHLESNNL